MKIINFCKRCDKKAELEFCKPCYLKVIEKRIRKYLRVNFKMTQDQTWLSFDRATTYMIKKIQPRIDLVTMPKSRFNIMHWSLSILKNQQVLSYIKANKINKVLLPLTKDSIIEDYIINLYKGNKHQKYSFKKFIPLFLAIDDKEFKWYLNERKIKFRLPNSRIREDIDTIENKYFGTKSSILSSITIKYI